MNKKLQQLKAPKKKQLQSHKAQFWKVVVTKLTCGGFVLALLLNHTMSDAFGLVQFLNTIAEMACGSKVPSIPPLWQREILNARNPPRVTCPHQEYQQVVTLQTPNSKVTNMVMDPKGSFFFSSSQIRKMRELLPKHLQNCTRLELLTSCVWKYRTIALELDPKEAVRVSCITSIRRKKNVNNLSLPLGYYGNTFAYPAAVSNVRVLHKSPLGFAVKLVKREKGQVNEEYMKSIADVMAIKGRPLHTVSGNYIVSDTTHVGFDEVDFGWGLPMFDGPAMALSLISMYVPYEEKREKGIVVLICLPTLVMERFEQELKKMTDEEKPYKMYHFKDLKIESSL